MYMEGDYDGALAEIDNAIAAVFDLEALAVELKERALLWIYIIEWLTILATGMIFGSLLWALMVRRRLYREVGATTFRL
jgi:hypothetical protein